MKNVKIISAILFYLTRVTAILYFMATLYALISIVTGWEFITFESGNYFAVKYPFTETNFLIGENNCGYKIFSFILPIGLYGVFFFQVSAVFNVFKQPKLFTQYGVTQLKWFCLTNSTIPPVTILLASIFSGSLANGVEILAIVHFFLGVFAYFLAAIFQQGLQLQNEQDLYI